MKLDGRFLSQLHRLRGAVLDPLCPCPNKTPRADSHAVKKKKSETSKDEQHLRLN